MKKQTIFVQNENVKIECLVFNQNDKQVPILFIPGAVNSAAEVAEDLKGNLTHYHIIISLRGRGQSDSPDEGYSIDNQASDIVAAANHFGLEHFYMVGHSIGSSIGIRAAAQMTDKVKGFVLGDYPPFYPPFDDKWVAQVLSYKGLQITETAIRGIGKDADYLDLVADLKQLACPILVLKAGKEDSAFPLEHTEIFKKLLDNCQVEILPESGHELFHTNPTNAVQSIMNFIASTEVPVS